MRGNESQLGNLSGELHNPGLLNASPANQFVCDVHPSQSGQQLLAAAVEKAYAEATSD
jgi:hypothetical protein